MRYEGILLDIDNTLYDYHKAHQKAMDAVAAEFATCFNVERSVFEEAFGKARKEIHSRLAETASSHNRMLYFQSTFELLGLNALNGALPIYHLYWDVFLSNIQVFDGVYELLEKYKNRICFITDLTAHIQHRKVQQMELYKYTSWMVTSEEAGIEKPASKIIEMGLAKLGLEAHQVCLIGDSLEKDVQGAQKLSIPCIWFNHEKKKPILYSEPNLVSEVHSFREILEWI